MQTLKYRCEFLQIGYDPEIYNPFGKSVNIADIVYMANMSSQFPLSGYRNDIVKELKKTYGDRFKCFGTGREDGNYMGNQEGEANVYRGAKIGINLSHYNYERYTSDRMFRMLGCGLLVLSHNYNGIDKDFTSGRHLIVWNDIHELKSQINFFLEHSVSAAVIGTDGYDLAIQNFTFAHMAKNIISLYHDNV
jgi:spore maturation protein CgeB